MGMFDTIRCEYLLPDPEHNALDFQTKSLDSCLNVYTITRDGRLLRHAQVACCATSGRTRRAHAARINANVARISS